jgi:hypothetical protein
MSNMDVPSVLFSKNLTPPVLDESLQYNSLPTYNTKVCSVTLPWKQMGQ